MCGEGLGGGGGGGGGGRQRDREVFSKHLSQHPAPLGGDPCLQAQLKIPLSDTTEVGECEVTSASELHAQAERIEKRKREDKCQ